MNNTLDTMEVRVLGCLMEKELATPEYYPLSLNALTNACNQKTNRAPVLSLDEGQVNRALNTLKEKRLVYQSDASRVAKYWQALSKQQDLGPGESALLALLLLRGPQTPGELRTRSDNLCGFESLEQVAQALEHLISTGLVEQLPRQPGQKEQRFDHLLAADERHACASEFAQPAPSAGLGEPEGGQLAELAQAVADLRQELELLKSDFYALKQELE